MELGATSACVAWEDGIGTECGNGLKRRHFLSIEDGLSLKTIICVIGTTNARHCEGGSLESNLNQFQKILDPNYTDGHFILF